MATVQILYWQEFPSQIKAEDAEGEVNIELPARFQERIDQIATQRGAVGTDAYLDGWRWSDPEERTGTAREVAEALRRELEASK